jgi:tRNA(fMet)-specific endonuclease VapC
LSGLLFDTDTLIDLARGERAVSERYLAALSKGAALHISTVTVFEFRYGMGRSRRQAAQESAFQQLLASVDIEPLLLADAEEASRVKVRLATIGRMIGSYDLLIAAQALTRALTLVTSNTREFARVAGLTVEDWREA